MSGYYDEYKKYKHKYLELKNGGNVELHITYKFELIDDEMIIMVTSNKDTEWFLGEQWCIDDINDKTIIQKTETMIHYTISKKIPRFTDDRLYCYPMVRKGYACFTGIIGLYLPMLSNDFTKFRVTFRTNFSLFVSGIGQISSTKTVQSDIGQLKTQLFVFTKSYIDTEIMTLTYKSNAYFFINKKQLLI